MADARQTTAQTKKSFREILSSHSERLYSLALAWLNVCTDQRLVAPLGTAAVPCGSAFGFTQQPCTRLLRVSAALGSMFPWRTRQRKVAWMCPAGQPNRS